MLHLRGLGASAVDGAASRGKCSRTPSLYQRAPGRQRVRVGRSAGPYMLHLWGLGASTVDGAASRGTASTGARGVRG